MQTNLKNLKILNLYGGLGGNRKYWTNCIVTMVEKNEQIANVYRKLYPDDIVIIGDAMEYLKLHYKEFDFVACSPPCQSNSKMVKATRHDVAGYADLSLYQIVIFLTHFFKGKWYVENVDPYYNALIKPTATIGRHLFWSNFVITPFKEPTIKGFITKDTVAETQELKDWLGIQYEGNIYYNGNHSPGQVLRNCIHPLIGEHLLKCALNKTELF